MKLNARSIFVYCAIFWALLFVFVVQGCHPVHADQQVVNCVSSKDSYGTNTTQCTDGTVTITGGGGATVCAKNKNGDLSCQTLK